MLNHTAVNCRGRVALTEGGCRGARTCRSPSALLWDGQKRILMCPTTVPQQEIVPIELAITPWLGADELRIPILFVDELMTAHILGIPRGIVAIFMVTFVATGLHWVVNIKMMSADSVSMMCNLQGVGMLYLRPGLSWSCCLQTGQTTDFFEGAATDCGGGTLDGFRSVSAGTMSVPPKSWLDWLYTSSETMSTSIMGFPSRRPSCGIKRMPEGPNEGFGTMSTALELPTCCT